MHFFCYADLSVDNAIQQRHFIEMPRQILLYIFCFSLFGTLSMDRPVEKMHVNELKELLRSKNVSLKGLSVKAQLVAK